MTKQTKNRPNTRTTHSLVVDKEIRMKFSGMKRPYERERTWWLSRQSTPWLIWSGSRSGRVIKIRHMMNALTHQLVQGSKPKNGFPPFSRGERAAPTRQYIVRFEVTTRIDGRHGCSDPTTSRFENAIYGIVASLNASVCKLLGTFINWTETWYTCCMCLKNNTDRLINQIPRLLDGWAHRMVAVCEVARERRQSSSEDLEVAFCWMINCIEGIQLTINKRVPYRCHTHPYTHPCSACTQIGIFFLYSTNIYDLTLQWTSLFLLWWAARSVINVLIWKHGAPTGGGEI